MSVRQGTGSPCESVGQVGNEFDNKMAQLCAVCFICVGTKGIGDQKQPWRRRRRQQQPPPAPRLMHLCSSPDKSHNQAQTTFLFSTQVCPFPPFKLHMLQPLSLDKIPPMPRPWHVRTSSLSCYRPAPLSCGAPCTNHADSQAGVGTHLTFETAASTTMNSSSPISVMRGCTNWRNSDMSICRGGGG